MGITTQIYLLTIVAVVTTALALGLIALRGPPPMPAPTRIGAIAETVQSGVAPQGASRSMHVSDHEDRPTVPDGMHASTQIAAAVQRLLPSGSPIIGVFSEAAGDVDDHATGSYPPGDEIRGNFVVLMRHGSGWRMIVASDADVRQHWWLTMFATVVLVLTLVAGLAWLFARSITGPLRHLADQAASGFDELLAADRGGSAGSSEVAVVATALRQAAQRQRDHHQAQVEMLAAIAHDLGTPLMRLAFRVEALLPDARNAAGEDIELMRRYISDSLALARSQLIAPMDVALAPMIERVVRQSRTDGAPLTLVMDTRPVVMGEPVALQRMVQNLIDNAQRYAGGGHVSLVVSDGAVLIAVEDDGPGIDPERLQSIADPFVRGDPSRNIATGGHGLGLAIARKIAERHGGTLTLGNRSGGGLRVAVRLPQNEASGVTSLGPDQ